ncbi:MAG: TAXI family TRAP transporter solute-binding subunit [Synergistaceae bacterium]|nr:TAXI family TRAP transporter solute-binding subunit [Synergistaceae bacterium]
MKFSKAIALGFMVALLACGAAFAAEIHITMGTAGVGGMNYPVGMAMAKIWNAEIKDMKAVAIATAGAVQNIDMLRTEDIEVAVCRAVEAYRATNGIEKYKEKLPWIRALTGGVMFDAKQVLALKGAGIESVSDFKGKRVAVGPVGSGGEADAREILAAYNLTYQDITPEYVEAGQAVDMMQDGLIHGAILGLTPGSSAVSELMLTGKAILLPLSDEGFENLKKGNPFIQRKTIPAGVYPNQDYEVYTAGDPADLIVCREELPEELVYQMTKALYQPKNTEQVRDVAAAVRQFGPALVEAPDKMMIPYHPGALRYFKEAGLIK